MGSALDNLLAVGNAALFALGGETVSFRGGSIIATIDRMPRPKDSGRKLDFDPRGKSSVFVLTGAVGSAPASGEVFTDSGNSKHRVETVTPNGSGWLCLCHVSGGAS